MSNVKDQSVHSESGLRHLPACVFVKLGHGSERRVDDLDDAIVPRKNARSALRSKMG